jgi:hypothetical protein
MRATQAPENQLRLAEEHIDWVLSHPDKSAWLKDALRMARSRDPVALLNDVELLQTLLQARSHALIEQLLTAPG